MNAVLLVDDEYLVRERLKRGVDWAAGGFQVVAEADNGEDALELLETVPIDLAIVDINMPLLDGLEFARRAAVRHPALKVVILTGYGTFEYAKTALRAGARDYLLKPINKQEFEELLRRMSDELREEAEERERRALERRQLEEGRLIRRERWLSRRLQSAAPHDPALFGQYLPALTDGSYIVMLVSPDPPDEDAEAVEDMLVAPVAVDMIEARDTTGDPDAADAPDPAYAPDRTYARDKAEKPKATKTKDKPDMSGADALMDSVWLEAMLGAGLAARGSLEWTWNVDARRLYIIANVAEGGERSLTEALTAGLTASCERTGRTASAGMSGIRTDWAQLSEAAAEAESALDCRSLAGGGRVFVRADTAARSGGAHIPAVRESLLVQLRLGSLAAATAAIDGWLGSCAAPDAPVARLQLLVGEIVAALRVHVSECGLAPGDYLPDALQPQALVRELATPPAIRRWLLGRTALVLAGAAAERKPSPALLVEKAVAYIDGAYADPELGLNEIAAHISVNPSYLSRLFKPATGHSVVEYITLRRMRRAEQLLAEGVRNLTYVSEAAGFADPQYFSKCFKKQYGIPPSRYGGVRHP